MPEAELKVRVETIQQRNFELMQRGDAAIVALIDAIVRAKKEGATEAQLQPALELQRKSQWRLLPGGLFRSYCGQTFDLLTQSTGTASTRRNIPPIAMLAAVQCHLRKVYAGLTGL